MRFAFVRVVQLLAMESKRLVKRAPVSRLNAKSAKIRKRLDFSSDDIVEKFMASISPVATSTPVVPSDPATTPATTEIKLPLGNNRFLCYNVCRGVDKIHVRQYEEKNGLVLPTKLGVCMSATRFAAFRFLIAEMDERVNDLVEKRAVDATIHVGGDLFVTVKTGFSCVNLRKYFFPAGMQQSVPSRSGIALRLPEWEALKACVAELIQLKPELANVGRCSDQEDHQNQIGYFNCGECNHLPPDFVPWQ